MYLQELVLDGFKSYATRTVITGWDKEFNAITGLNGSGKSNILDAICFVLGITNLSQVVAIMRMGLMRISQVTNTFIFTMKVTICKCKQL